MNYLNMFCPVCKENFKDDDDIVVCPECGTPHHRECWNKNEKCVNTSLHNTDEDISSTYTRKEKNSLFGDIPEIKNSPISGEISGSQPQNEKPFENYTDKAFQEKAGNVNPSQTMLIEGREAVYYEIGVAKNNRYYIPRFLMMNEKSEKIISYNVMAFISPFAWSIYRKMYKFALLFLALYTAIFSINGYFLFNDGEILESIKVCYEENPEYTQNILMYMSGENVELTQKQQKLIEVFESKTLPRGVSIALWSVPFVLRFLYALKANKIYMNSIKKTIVNGEKLGYTGDKLKMYIYRKKGVVPFIICAFIGYFEFITTMM